jgi:DNA-binding MarR family transcriptional regulator
MQQGKRPVVSSNRRALVADLNRAAREASGLGNIFAMAVAERLGIHPTDVECVGIIAAAGRVTAGDLARSTGLTTGAITGVIDRLVRAGLARRERDGKDRRKVHVVMTAAGRRRAEGYYLSLGENIDRLATHFTAAEIAFLTRYFDATRDVMLAEIATLKE